MKRYFNVLIMTSLFLLILSGCSNKKSKKSKTFDSEFTESLVHGLENRWDYIDDKKYEETKQSLTKLDNLELDQIKKYENKKFKNSQLHQLALTYINDLESQKKSLEYYGSDKFDDKYDATVSKRCETLLKINNTKKLKFPKEYQDSWDELKGTGKATIEDNSRKTKLKQLMDNIQFQNIEQDDTGWSTYEATVSNNTGFEIKFFGINVKLKDESGTTVDTIPVNVSDWGVNQKEKLKFDTDQQFATTEIVESYINY